MTRSKAFESFAERAVAQIRSAVDDDARRLTCGVRVDHTHHAKGSAHARRILRLGDARLCFADPRYPRAVTNEVVHSDPEIMSGALCFTGTRVPVKNLFDYLEGSSCLDDFLEDFPTVSREAAVAVLEAARERFFSDASVA